MDFNGTYYYYLRNGQGDVVKLTDGSRNTVVEYTYDSRGKPLSCTGTLATTLGVLNPFRYRGYVFDEETGFYYLKSRYYDPEICRFISADVLLSTGQGVIGHNCYAYCDNNPIMDVDPTGTWNWGGVITGLGLIAATVIIVATFGVGVGVGAVIAGAAITTGAVMTYAAATDSTMVVDVSWAATSPEHAYVKTGQSVIIDFSSGVGVYSYKHNGIGVGYSSGPSYFVGLVQNFNKPEDYSNEFVDIHASKTYGYEHCYNPTRPYNETVKANCVSFGDGLDYGLEYDYYSGSYNNLFKEASREMIFDYSVYYRQNCLVPLELLAFCCLWCFLAFVAPLLRHSSHTEQSASKQGLPIVFSIIIVGSLMLPNIIRLCRGGIYLLVEKDTDAIYVSGTIESTMDIDHYTGSKYDVDENKGYGQALVVNGKKWYIMTCGTLQPRDYVEMCVLPKSGFVLKIEKKGS